MLATQIFFICLIAGLILVGGEIFVPGGLLGALGGLLLLAAVVTGFIAFPAGGPYVALGIVLAAGAAFYLWTRVFPQTSLGRHMTVSNDMAAYKAVSADLPALVGKEGVALSALRPAGFARIDGRRVDVITRGDLIAKDTPIRVVAVDGNRVFVARLSVKSETAT